MWHCTLRIQLPKGADRSKTRLKETVRRFLEQKVNDRNFDARRDDRSAQGSAVKRRGEGIRRSRERKQGQYVGNVTRADSRTMKERKGDYWHPLSVPNTQQKKGANSSNKCFFIHNEDKNSQGKKHEKDAKPGKAKPPW